MQAIWCSLLQGYRPEDVCRSSNSDTRTAAMTKGESVSIHSFSSVQSVQPKAFTETVFERNNQLLNNLLEFGSGSQSKDYVELTSQTETVPKRVSKFKSLRMHQLSPNS